MFISFGPNNTDKIITITAVIVIRTIIIFVEFIIPMVYLAYRVTQLDLSSLDRLTGLLEWREREAAALSQVVQQRLHKLQNPTDCHTAKKLVCQADRVGGWVYSWRAGEREANVCHI